MGNRFITDYTSTYRGLDFRKHSFFVQVAVTVVCVCNEDVCHAQWLNDRLIPHCDIVQPAHVAAVEGIKSYGSKRVVYIIIVNNILTESPTRAVWHLSPKGPPLNILCESW